MRSTLILLRPIRTALFVGLVAFNLSCGGDDGPTPPTPVPTPPPPPATTLSALSLNPASMQGGGTSQGTATISAAASAGGAVVTLSSNNAAATVPANVTVAAGATTGTFSVSTTAVTTQTSVTITGAHGGVNQTATLTLMPAGPPPPPPLAAAFSVRSTNRGADACVIVDGGNALDCEFDARASTGSPTAYQWTYFVGKNMGRHGSSDPITRPQAGCNFLRDQDSTTVNGVQFVQMEVRLQVQDSRGNLSPEVRNLNVRMFPNNLCGYGF
jgi:hypothetical protein